ncbi:alpha/beta fold hydrolase [Pseudohalocynthiibacter aestuariivivens]|uniref:Alpha/beta fold hydrolase n=1 Tax=Pseudohalocynthiibacter aestuariivivens TaxID=1591409 RepID=A0ABV5JHX9_9RHOB|nr:alpha/beta hydrolase [Pseudohalocynthiibacter aestuariivivens]MBS9717364.1 alpha/beta hydrolase [Pseudohalocynthiibacter aestuariivivens]
MKHYTSSDGLTLAFQDEGEGLPLLCLSGLTRNSTDFDYVVPHLKNIRVIRPDYRGRGASEHADYTTYTVPTEARDVLELMDHLGLEKAAILGTSRGGLIAMGLAGTVKDRLLGVCLNDIGPEIAHEGLRNIMTYLGRRPPQKTFEDAAIARAKFMVGFHDVPISRWDDEVRKHYVETDHGLGITYDAKLRRAVEVASAQPALDLWPFFDALQGLPLALIRGENSDLLSPETASEMQRRRPDMVFANIPDRAHVPFLDEPESLEIISQFLDKIR